MLESGRSVGLAACLSWVVAGWTLRSSLPRGRRPRAGSCAAPDSESESGAGGPPASRARSSLGLSPSRSPGKSGGLPASPRASESESDSGPRPPGGAQATLIIESPSRSRPTVTARLRRRTPIIIGARWPDSDGGLAPATPTAASVG